jgi:hypothetical protein
MTESDPSEIFAAEFAVLHNQRAAPECDRLLLAGSGSEREPPRGDGNSSHFSAAQRRGGVASSVEPEIGGRANKWPL